MDRAPDTPVNDQAAAPEGQEIALSERMNVLTLDHQRVGHVSCVLVDSETEEPGFLVFLRDHDNQTVLAPVEIIETETNGDLVTTLSLDQVGKLPAYDESEPPTREAIEQACEAVGIEARFEER